MSFERRDLALTREILARIGWDEPATLFLRFVTWPLCYTFTTHLVHFCVTFLLRSLFTFATHIWYILPHPRYAFLELVARLDYYYWRFVPNL